MAHGVYHRYVALGDSQTEGLWDGNDSEGIVGFADRLATEVDALHARPALRQPRDPWPPDPRCARRPTAAGPCDAAGPDQRMRRNERHHPPWTAFRPRTGRSRPVARTSRAIRRDGADDNLPRYRADRSHRQNPDHADAADQRGNRHGLGALWVQAGRPVRRGVDDPAGRLERRPCARVDEGAPAFCRRGRRSPRTAWQQPRLGEASRTATKPTLRSRAYSQMLWTKHMLAPWIWDHARGISSGDGREPKRPQMAGLVG